MDILPQPNNPVPVAHTPNVITLSHGNTSWRPPSILDRTKHSVVRAVIYLGDIFAIDERGEFLPCAVQTPIIVKQIKQQRSRVIDVAVISSQLAIVLEDKVYIYNKESLKEVYTGRCSAIYPGYSHAYLKTPTGYKFYGSSTYGQYGAKATSATTFIDMKHLDDLQIEQLYSGGWHAYGKTKQGTFYGWGYNNSDRLGNNMFGHAYRPILLDHHKLGIYTLACGGWHTLGLTTNGNVYVWGANTDNNLGVEGVVKITTPYLLLEGKNIINMFTGRSYSNYVQSKDGTMYVWGKNSNFQFFGNEHAEIITTPMIYEELRDLPIRNVFVGIEASIFTLETRIRGFVIKNSAALADVYITCR